MLDSTKRLQRAIAAGVLRTCTRCGSPEGHRITRFEKDPERWSLDLSLHFNASDVWRRPSKVVLRKTGLCQWCSEPYRGGAHPLAHPPLKPFLTCKEAPLEP